MQGNTSEILATVRCQAGTRRIWLQMRTIVNSGPDISEGTQVLVYVLPAGAPRVARLIKLSLPALPQYSQHDDPDRDDDRSTIQSNVCLLDSRKSNSIQYRSAFICLFSECGVNYACRAGSPWLR